MKPKLSSVQGEKLVRIRKILEGFYEDNDNGYTYPLTGLLTELTKTDYVDESYVREKVNLLFGRRNE